MKKGLPTKHTSKPLYMDRECIKCSRYPCFEGIDKMKTDFAKAGCLDWEGYGK